MYEAFAVGPTQTHLQIHNRVCVATNIHQHTHARTYTVAKAIYNTHPPARLPIASTHTRTHTHVRRSAAADRGATVGIAVYIARCSVAAVSAQASMVSWPLALYTQFQRQKALCGLSEDGQSHTRLRRHVASADQCEQHNSYAQKLCTPVVHINIINSRHNYSHTDH